MTRANVSKYSIFLFLATLPFLADAVGHPFMVVTFNRIVIYALFAMSLDLVLGYGGMVSFGHAAFLGIGAYVCGVLSFHAFEGSSLWLIEGTNNALISWPLAMGVTAVAALIVGALSMRTGGVYFIMITLAFAQMFFFFFISLEGYGGDDGLVLMGRNELLGMDLSDDTTFYYVSFAALMGFLFLYRRLVDSRFGMVIRGCKQNEERLSTLGFPVFRYKLVCFMVSGAGTGLAGALLANFAEFVSPDLLHWSVSGEAMIMVIMGGIGTLVGPIYGAAGLLMLEELLSSYTEHWKIFLGPLLILIILFASRGIHGWLTGRGAGNG